jgi:hypothetical protein
MIVARVRPLFFSIRYGQLGGTQGGTRPYSERLEYPEPEYIGLPSPLNPCRLMNFLILTRHYAPAPVPRNAT